jgi:tripartite ATP-independent transporter DctP family solute receptor
MHRMSFRRFSAISMVLVLVVAACAPAPPAAAPTAAPQPIPFRVASDNLPPAPVLRCGMETMRTELQGKFDVRVFHSSQLGQAAQVLQLVKAGEFEASMVGPGQLQAFYAPMGIFSAIYVIDDHEHMRRVMGTDVWTDLMKGLNEKATLAIPAMLWYGTRQLTSNKAVRTPADMAGLKMRVAPGSQVAFTNGRAMGANPTTLPFGELYLGLSQGVVEAQENPLPTIDEAKFYEVQQFLNLTNHEPSPQFLVVNSNWYAKLGADQRKAFDDASKKAEAATLDCTLKAEKELLDKWKAQGTFKGGIIENVDVAAFRDRAAPILMQEYGQVWGELDLYNRIRAASPKR